MTHDRLPVRLALGFAILRGVVLIAYSLLLIDSPERMLAGSGVEPARTLGLMFASRSIVLGAAFIACALKRMHAWLAWILLGDAVLQVFDTAMAAMMGKYATMALPVAIGAVEVLAAVTLLRAARKR